MRMDHDDESADESADDGTGPLSGRIVDDGNPPVLDHRHDHHKLRRSRDDDLSHDTLYSTDPSTASPSSLKDKEKAHFQNTTPTYHESTALQPPPNKSSTAQPPDHATDLLDLPTNLSARFRNYMLHGPPSAAYAISCVGEGEAVDFQGLMRDVDAVSGSVLAVQKQDGEDGEENGRDEGDGSR
jgi:hypothetical protein